MDLRQQWPLRRPDTPVEMAFMREALYREINGLAAATVCFIKESDDGLVSASYIARVHGFDRQNFDQWVLKNRRKGKIRAKQDGRNYFYHEEECVEKYKKARRWVALQKQSGIAPLQ